MAIPCWKRILDLTCILLSLPGWLVLMAPDGFHVGTFSASGTSGFWVGGHGHRVHRVFGVVPGHGAIDGHYPEGNDYSRPDFDSVLDQRRSRRRLGRALRGYGPAPYHFLS